MKGVLTERLAIKRRRRYKISTMHYSKNVLEKSALLTVDAILAYIDIAQRVKTK